MSAWDVGESVKHTHTPGPWNAECVGSGGAFDNPVDVYEIATPHKRIAEYVSEADALLIAAAPDLLAALELVIDHDGALTGGDLTTIRAAIAKARGES